MSFFFDASALVKIYHQEEESPDVLDIFNSNSELFISELSVIEYHSVIHRKIRENILDEVDVKRILKRLDIDLEKRFNLLIFNSSVIENAREVFHFLGNELLIRSLDVLQIGFFRSYLKRSDKFLTYDVRQKSVFEELKSKDFF